MKHWHLAAFQSQSQQAYTKSPGPLEIRDSKYISAASLLHTLLKDWGSFKVKRPVSGAKMWVQYVTLITFLLRWYIMLLHVRNAVVHNSNIRGVETCSGWIFKSGSCKILSCARPLPQKYILSGPAPAEIYLIWSRSRRNISYLVPLPPAKFMFCSAPACKRPHKSNLYRFFSVHRRNLH